MTLNLEVGEAYVSANGVVFDIVDVEYYDWANCENKDYIGKSRNSGLRYDFSDTGSCHIYPRYSLVSRLEPEAKKEDAMVNSDGGPSKYYDFPQRPKTLNDLIEFKKMDFHRGNTFKAAYRFGEKGGTTKSYDCKKIIYSGVRMLMVEDGVKVVREYLQSLLDDPQFRED